MYKTFFLCVIGFLVLGRPMLCQTGKIDSLNRALDAAKSRIDKTRLLNALSEEFRNYDPSTSIKLADSALTFALNLDDRAEVANAYFNKGRADALLGNFALSRLYLWRAIKLYDELLVSQPALRLVMLRQKSRSLNTIGETYRNQGNFPAAKKYYYSTFPLSSESNYTYGIAAALNNIGLVFRQQGNYAEAIKYYLASLKISEDSRDQTGISSSYINIGIIFDDQGNYPEALKYHIESAKIAQRTGNSTFLSATLNNVGLTYFEMEDYRRALRYHNEALRINKKKGDKRGVSGKFITERSIPKLNEKT